MGFFRRRNADPVAKPEQPDVALASIDETSEAPEAAPPMASDATPPGTSLPSEDEAPDREVEAPSPRWQRDRSSIAIYAQACEQVVDRANACQEPAQMVLNGRARAAEPQHENSVAAFQWATQNAEREFRELFDLLEAACLSVRDIAASLRSADLKGDPETLLSDSGASEATLNKVGAARRILRSRLSSAPGEFLEEFAAMRDVDPGSSVIYSPRAPDETHERSCPWCFEPVEVEAATCRFCGNDTQTPPNHL